MTQACPAATPDVVIKDAQPAHRLLQVAEGDAIGHPQHRALAPVLERDLRQSDLRDWRAREELIAELGEEWGPELAVLEQIDTVWFDR